MHGSTGKLPVSRRRVAGGVFLSFSRLVCAGSIQGVGLHLPRDTSWRSSSVVLCSTLAAGWGPTAGPRFAPPEWGRCH